MSRAAFFDYDDSTSGYRFIVLTGDSPVLETSERHQHEEGWSSTYTRWELDGDVVTCSTYTGGRDCDGRHSSTFVVACPVGELAAREVYADGNDEASVGGPLPFRVPAWAERSRGQRDYSAEAAGY
jgi:hypothetical protein